MAKIQESHVDEDILELYVMQRLGPEEVASLEGHLEDCSHCREALRQAREFVSAIRIASKRLKEQEATRHPRPASSRWLPNRAHTAPALVAVAAGLALFFVRFPASPPPQQQVTLIATRSGEVATVTHGLRVKLVLDAAGLESSTAYLITAVDAHGRVTWQGTATRDRDEIPLLVEPGIPPGTQWVRVSVPGSDRKPLREYQIEVR